MADFSAVSFRVFEFQVKSRRVTVHKKSTLRSLDHALSTIEPIGSIPHFGDTDGNRAARFMKKSSDGVRIEQCDPPPEQARSSTMKRVILASVAILGLTGFAAAQEAPSYLSEQAAIASGVQNNQMSQAPQHSAVDLFTTSAVPGHRGNVLGNYGPTVTPEALNR
jgi:hypothetical protein